jgi:hypothetical protein
MQICRILAHGPRTVTKQQRNARPTNGNTWLRILLLRLKQRAGWPIWRIWWRISRRTAAHQSLTKPLAESLTKAYLCRRRVLPFSYAVKFQWPYIIRGSWLCLDPGSFTWHPPVHTGPRELSYQHGCTGGPATCIHTSFSNHKALIQLAISCIDASAVRSLPQACK